MDIGACPRQRQKIMGGAEASSACPRQKMALFYEDKKEKEEK